MPAAQSWSLQPRYGRMESRGSPSSAIRRTCASHGSIPAPTRTLTCPSPRCSRSRVAACQSARWGASGQESATFAANSGRPATDARVDRAADLVGGATRRGGGKIRGESVAHRAVDPFQARVDRGVRLDPVPDRRQRTGDELRVEPEERRGDELRRGDTERSRAAGEVPPPEAPEPRRLERRVGLWREVRQRVERLGEHPDAPCVRAHRRREVRWVSARRLRGWPAPPRRGCRGSSLRGR